VKLQSIRIGFLSAILMFLLSHVSLAGDQDLEGLRQKIASPNYETRRSAVIDLFHTGEKRPLTKAEIDLLLPHLKLDADWRIKVRITLVLPYAANPDWVLQPLISALQDRDEESSGGGNVPTAACSALARLADRRGLQPSEDWLNYLESNPKCYRDLHNGWVEIAKKNIAELKSKLEKTAH